MLDLRRIAVTGLSLFALVVSFDPALAFLAYVSNEKSNTISVIDTDKMETIATVKTGQRPRGIEVSRDGKSVFVALGDDDTIQIIDTKSLNIVGDLPSGPDPEQFTLDPAGKFLYVANENDSMVTIIDMEKRAEDKKVQEIDWEQFLENRTLQQPLPSGRGGFEDLPPIEQNLTKQQNLVDHLRWQLQMSDFTDTEQRLIPALQPVLVPTSTAAR